MYMGVRGAFTLSVGASEAPILHSKAHTKQARDLSKSGNISFVSQIIMYKGNGWVWAMCVHGYLMHMGV